MEIGYALMQQQSVSYYKASVSFGKIGDGKYDLRMRCIVPNSLPHRSLTKPGLKAKKRLSSKLQDWTARDLVIHSKLQKSKLLLTIILKSFLMRIMNSVRFYREK